MSIHRRSFLALTATAAATWARAQQLPIQESPVERLTPGPTPAIALNHLGFVPESKKVVVVKEGGPVPAQFTMREIGSALEPFQISGPLTRSDAGMMNGFTGDFSHVRRVGMYQITVNGERSVPFSIGQDTWRRTLPKVVGYHKYQRCGVSLPNVHPACHLDEARRRDNGKHIDMTGGWHDAGDLRKWMGVTMMNAIGLLWVLRNLGDGWDLAGSGSAPIREEVRWGNRYFLKMQDKDGLVFADVAGGLNSDNSDNHWTDNRIGTPDDRYINVSKPDLAQGIFATMQAMIAQEFAQIDPQYSKACLNAAVHCWNAAKRSVAQTLELAWWTLASLELRLATKNEDYGNTAVNYGAQLLALQNVKFTGNQRQIRGFWHTDVTDSTPYCQAIYSALPGLALWKLANDMPDRKEAVGWRDAIRLHLDEYVLPISTQSCYRIVPFGVFHGSPTPEVYNPLAGELTFRYFMPTRKQFWWLGTTSHLECYAVLLASAAQLLNRTEYRELAYRQLEWIMGANPFGACLMTGEGARNPYPHSRYIGLIPGGIMNGIAGNARDEPILDTQNLLDWRTVEYWSPHNAFYEWAVSALEREPGSRKA